VLSLALHCLLCFYLYQTRFAPADLALAPRSEPPVFKVKPIDTQAALDKASLDQTNPAAKPEPDKTNVQLPDEKKSFDALLQEVQATTTNIKRPNMFTSKIQADSAGPNKNRVAGFSDLYSLLAQKGPLGSGTAIRMPDDQLFQYDSAELQASSVEQLQKLGTLIRRNPKATFSIEGYTDAFGGYEYNLDLSQRRADSVKNYLVSVMGINSAQIQTRGYGATKFLVPPRPVMDPSMEQ